MRNRPTRVSTTRTASMFCLECAICSTLFSILWYLEAIFIHLGPFFPQYLYFCIYMYLVIWFISILIGSGVQKLVYIHTRIYPYKTFISSIPSYSILLSKLLVLATCSFVTHRCLFLSATVAILDGRCRSEYHAPD